jgi:hypothetical protein
LTITESRSRRTTILDPFGGAVCQKSGGFAASGRVQAAGDQADRTPATAIAEHAKRAAVVDAVAVILCPQLDCGSG